MKYAALGQTDLVVSQLAFGTAPLGGLFGPLGEPEAIELVHQVLDLGMARFVADEAAVTYDSLRPRLREQTRRGQLYPVFFGSAITGAGVTALSGGITELLPAAHGDTLADLSGTVFKVERGSSGEKVANVSVFAGAVHLRDRLQVGDDLPHTVTRIAVFENGGVVRRDVVSAGQIGQLWGLGGVRIGDAIGVPGPARPRFFAPPSLETVVRPDRASDAGTLYAALVQLAEQDPLINFRLDEAGEIAISLYGEVQKEVIGAVLADDFGVAVTFRETSTLCIEHVIGSGSAAEVIYQESNPFLATVGLRVDPAPVDTGIAFALEVQLGSMPLAFFKAVEGTVRETLRQGRYGWPVPDCVVTMTHSGYAARQSHAHATFDKSMSSTASDFRLLTPLALLSALNRAGTVVCEPFHQFELEIPVDTLGAILPVLARFGAVAATPTMRGADSSIRGEIPAAQVHALTRRLPGLTRGEAVFESTVARFVPLRGAPRVRPRTDHNPLDRKNYLIAVTRRSPTPAG